jgi:hypothetical protein
MAASLAPPRLGLFAGGSEHPLADALDQAGFLGQRHKFCWRHQTALGVSPAQQRLDPDNATPTQFHLRLVVQFQLLAFQRMA